MRGDPETVAAVIGLKKSGGEWKGPCPLCGGRDRFHVKRGHQHDLIFLCRAGCRFQDIAQFLGALGLIKNDFSPDFEAGEQERLQAEALTLLRAFCRDVQREGVVLGSQQKRAARAAVRRLTGMTPDELMFMWCQREAFFIHIHDQGGVVVMSDEQMQHYIDIDKAIKPWEWMLWGIQSLLTRH